MEVLPKDVYQQYLKQKEMPHLGSNTDNQGINQDNLKETQDQTNMLVPTALKSRLSRQEEEEMHLTEVTTIITVETSTIVDRNHNSKLYNNAHSINNHNGHKTVLHKTKKILEATANSKETVTHSKEAHNPQAKDKLHIIIKTLTEVAPPEVDIKVAQVVAVLPDHIQ